jgi:hypothetical protein
MKFNNKSLVQNSNSLNNKDKVIISSEYYEDDRPSYICSICNRTLNRLSDAGGNNQV